MTLTATEVLLPSYRVTCSSGRVLCRVSHYQRDNQFIAYKGGKPGFRYNVNCPECQCGDWREDGPTFHFECENCGERVLFVGVDGG